MKTKKHELLTLFFLVLFLSTTNNANGQQSQNNNYLSYIETYKNLAIAHQSRYKIPASIKLSQGLLESSAGKSILARDANNHFGIKCGSGWTGEQIYADDDKPKECFRKYSTVKDSYEDHSKFLSEKSRYAPLFLLEADDYKSWAEGLKKCGYATDPLYASKLINLIKTYQLYQFDKKGFFPRDIYKTFGLIYVIATSNDSFRSIASDLNFKEKDLLKYNEVPSNFRLQQGDIIYLQKKKKKADKPYYDHIVRAGESMHDISQRYGIQLSALYKMNKKNIEFGLTEGDILRLR